MTIETISAGVAQIPTPSEAITSAIEQWVGGLDIAMRGAEMIVDTPACPDSLWPLPPDMKVWSIPGRNPKLQLPNEPRDSYLARRTIAAQTAGFIVRYGLGLGMPPEVALTNIFVVGNRPSMYAETMVALIKSRGHSHRVVERGDERCVVEVREGKDGDWQPFEFTMEQAVRAGYVKGKGPNENGKGGNDKYNTDPAGMLYARATSIACRTVFPDLLRGMQVYEVAGDDLVEASAQDLPSTPVQTSAPVSAAAILAAPLPPAAAPAPESVQAAPVVEEAPVPSSPAPPAPAAPAAASEPTTAAVVPEAKTEPAKPARARKAPRTPESLFKRLAVTRNAERAVIVERIVGRQVSGYDQLLPEEMTVLLDTLEAIASEADPGVRVAELLAPAQPEVPVGYDVEDPPADSGWPAVTTAGGDV